MGKAISTWTSVGHVRAAQFGAYCLDGSTPGYWYQPPMPLPRTSQWLIFLDGGAWCYDAHSCESRAKGFKGTGEKSIPQSNFWPYAGHMDADPKVNPIFSGFHRLHFHYCDGSSYSGDREAPLPSEGKKLLYLRGRRVLAAQLDTALQAGLRDAEEVPRTKLQMDQELRERNERSTIQTDIQLSARRLSSMSTVSLDALREARRVSFV